MTRYIDADALEKDLAKRWEISYDQEFGDKEVWNALKEAPTADVVEAVRCGECKYMQTDGKCDAFADFSIRPSVSDYCSYGTLKGGEE